MLLRASIYTTGGVYESRTTPVLGCAWLYVYPFISGKLNYVMTGLGWGMKALRLLPEGLVLLSIPFDLLPMIATNLADMEWEPPAYSDGRDGYIARFSEVERGLADA